jgi:parallel beta-helix repeat protein
MPAKPRHAAPATLAVILSLAVAGFVALTGAQAAKQPKCGDTITTDTTLHKNLVNCPNNGIIIGADNITLDLNGHEVNGDGALVPDCPADEFCDLGLLNDGHDGVTLKDGSVRQFAFGTVVVSSRHNRVVDMTVSRSDGTGIILFKSSRNRLIRNVSRANGLQFDQGGIALNSSDHNLLKRNALRRNGDLGLFMEKSDHNRIRKNRMSRNPEGGIIAEGHGNVFGRNHIVRIGGGILITKITGHGAVGNVVRRNYVRGARGDGISVDPVPKRTRIRRNRVRGSGGDGIDVGTRSTKLTSNRVRRNGDLGIEAVRGVIDGGGNRASGNGDPRQCTNIVCS